MKRGGGILLHITSLPSPLGYCTDIVISLGHLYGTELRSSKDQVSILVFRNQ